MQQFNICMVVITLPKRNAACEPSLEIEKIYTMTMLVLHYPLHCNFWDGNM